MVSAGILESQVFFLSREEPFIRRATVLCGHGSSSIYLLDNVHIIVILYFFVCLPRYIHICLCFFLVILFFFVCLRSYAVIYLFLWLYSISNYEYVSCIYIGIKP